METLGAPELLIILLLALLFFGANKLPEIGKDMGDSDSQFQSGFEKRSRCPRAARSGNTCAKVHAGMTEISLR